MPLKLPDFVGLDRTVAVDALFQAYVTLSTIAGRPTAEEGLGEITAPNPFELDPHELISMDRDAYIGLARETRDRITALIRQSRGHPANQNGCG